MVPPACCWHGYSEQLEVEVQEIACRLGRKSRARCASRSFRCALAALPDGVGWLRERDSTTATACWRSSPAAEDFQFA